MNKREIKMEEVKKSDKKLLRKFCRNFRQGVSDKVINMFEELHPMIRHELVLQSFEMYDTSELAKFVLDHEKLKPTDEDKYAFLKCMGIKAEGDKFDSYEDDEDFIIASWNVNGIRARIFNELTSAQCKKSQTKEISPNSSLNKLINDADPSVICFQEIKCDASKLKCFGVNGEKRSDGWYTYWNCAEKLNYSGVGIMSKQKAKEIDTGLINTVDKVGIPDIWFQNLFYPDGPIGLQAQPKFVEIATELESEGRILCAKYTYKSKDIWIINLYSPNTLRAGAKKADGKYLKPHFIYRRRVWEKLIILKIEYLMRTSGFLCPIILCGDLNVARSQLDIYHGVMTTALLENESWRINLDENPGPLTRTAKAAKRMEKEAGAGYRREEREMMEDLLVMDNMVSFQLDEDGSTIQMHDVWREKHPEDLQEIIEQGEGYDYGFTFWDPKNLPHRPKNFGWRIDYFLVDDNTLKDYSLEINVFPEVGEKVYDDQGEVVLSSGGNEVVASDHAPIVLTIKDVELEPPLVKDLNTIADKIEEEEKPVNNMDLDDVVVVNPNLNAEIEDTSDSDDEDEEYLRAYEEDRRQQMIDEYGSLEAAQQAYESHIEDKIDQANYPFGSDVVIAEEEEDINYSELFNILNDYEQENEWANNTNFPDFMENLPLKLSNIGYMSGKLCYDEINDEIMSPDNFNTLKSALEQNIKLLDEKSEKLTNDSVIISQLVSEIAKHNEEIKELNDKVVKLRKELKDGFDENERAIDFVRHQQDIDFNVGLATDKYKMDVKGLEEDLAEKEESMRAELLEFLNIYSVVVHILLFFTILCMKINKITIPGINPMQLFRTLDSLLAKTELSTLRNNLRKDKAYRKTLQ